ncbi:MAG: preprotein translocase subunit SecY [Candidatus Parcubacteria bacterium]|nr:preprotein translocase subunit SecY [Candidatus Parcubacteria bacterium]
MFKLLGKLFLVKDLRRRVFIIVGLLIVFRLLSVIPLPDVDPIKLKAFFESNQFFGLLNIFSGGALDKLSIGMLGVAPYITASIIMQLLTMVFPNIKEMFYGEGESGRTKFEQFTKYLAVPMAIIQGIGFLNLLRFQGIISFNSPLAWVQDIVLITATSMFLTWLGDLITEQKMGNGISLIIFAGIVVELPRLFGQTFATFDPTKLLGLIAFIVSSLIIIAGVVYVTEAQRKIPVSYAKRVRGTKMYGGVSTFLPLKVNHAGVIPIIFALSILLLPSTIGQMLSAASNPTIMHFGQSLAGIFNNQWIYGILYFLMVFIFTFFYTSITFEPKMISENLQKNGGFIPGYRPGQMTATYLAKTAQRITLFGAIFLGLIAVVPMMIQGATGISTLTIGGTSILIMVSVALETLSQIKAQLLMREYEEY